MVQLVSQLRGFFYINPILALTLAITIFSFIGVPPLIGFFAKQMVLSAVLDNGVRRESHSVRGNSPILTVYLTILNTTLRLY